MNESSSLQSRSTDWHESQEAADARRSCVVRWWLVVTTIPVASFTCVLVTAALLDLRSAGVVFGPLVLSEMTMLTPPPPPAINVVPHFSAYFENGTARASGVEDRRIRRFAKAFFNCDPGLVSIIGFASSASYRGALGVNDAGNRELARERAEAVKNILGDANFQLRMSESQIFSKRIFFDSRRIGASEHPAEYLNRRVDVFLEYPECKSPQHDASK